MGVASSWNDMYKEKLSSIEEGPEYKPFHDLRYVPGSWKYKGKIQAVLYKYESYLIYFLY
jgi:hypothetical protein